MTAAKRAATLVSSVALGVERAVREARPYHVTFVCSGNICRSPMGEVILTRLLAEAGLAEAVRVDSAGTGDWHVGGGADARTLTALALHGYDGAAHVARQFVPDWFAERDLVLAADEGHLRQLRSCAPTDQDREKVLLMREFDPQAVSAGTLEVDDPWYGDAEDFERCFCEVERSCRGLVDRLRTVIAATWSR